MVRSSPTEISPPDAAVTPVVTGIDLGSDAAVFVTDADGVILDVNRAFTRLTGYSREDAIGATPRLLNSGRQDEAYYQALWSTITSGHVWEGELVDRHRDGRLRTHQVTITPVRQANGRISHYVAVERDLSSDLAREAGPQGTGLLHTDPGGRCIYADDRAAALLGTTPDVLLGHGLWRRLQPDDAAAMAEAVATAARTGRPRRLQVRTREGTLLHVELGGLTLATGTLIGARGVVEDVTDRDARVREHDRQLALVDSVLDALEDPIAVIGPDGLVVTVNRAWRDEPWTGRCGLENLRDGDDALAAVERAARDGSEETSALAADLRAVVTGWPRPQRRPTEVTAHPLRWDEGGAILRARRNVAPISPNAG